MALEFELTNDMLRKSRINPSAVWGHPFGVLGQRGTCYPGLHDVRLTNVASPWADIEAPCWGFRVTIASNVVAKSPFKRSSANLTRREYYKPILNNMKTTKNKTSNRESRRSVLQLQGQQSLLFCSIL
jgi:hypothetical protein